MVKISHEVPPVLLRRSIMFNDYDYFLIHLMDKENSQYMEFYNYSKSLNRMQILDNSACELRGKEEFDFDTFAHRVYELEPKEYLIPDVFNDYEKNIEYFDRWMKKYGDIQSLPIATVHGKTYEQWVEAYNYFKKFNVKIAFNFDEILYNEYKVVDNEVLDRNPVIRKSKNRVRILRRLVAEGVIDQTKKHHLLGCHSADEYCNYVDWVWIDSIDTSNPVMMTLDNRKYSDEGNFIKPEISIDDVQNIKDSDINYDLLYYNLKWFRKNATRRY